MLIEIARDVWINSDYIVSVVIDEMPHLPVLITMDAPDQMGEALTYRVSPKAWEHIRIQLKLYSRLPKSVEEPQSGLEASAEDHKPSSIDGL